MNNQRNDIKLFIEKTSQDIIYVICYSNNEITKFIIPIKRWQLYLIMPYKTSNKLSNIIDIEEDPIVIVILLYLIQILLIQYIHYCYYTKDVLEIEMALAIQ